MCLKTASCMVGFPLEAEWGRSVLPSLIGVPSSLSMKPIRFNIASSLTGTA